MSQSWQADAKAIQRVLQRMTRYERESRFLRKRSEEYQVLEEVFDRPTLLTLYEMMNQGGLDYLNGVVNAGKEARVYCGVKDGSEIAVKIFLVVAREFRRRLHYILGDPRFTRVSRSSRKQIRLWAHKEFRNLQEAYQAGVSVPRPILVQENVIMMEFIGERGQAAPTLNAVEVSDTDYQRVLEQAQRLYRDAGLVHADLSEYNVFRWQDRAILFDFGSGVAAAHPNAQRFLTRDLTNINRFFERRGVATRPVDVLVQELGIE